MINLIIKLFDFSTESFNFEKNPNLITLTIACAFTCVWFLFIAFYNSQILGMIVTKILQKFVIPDGHLYIGKTFSILPLYCSNFPLVVILRMSDNVEVVCGGGPTL